MYQQFLPSFFCCLLYCLTVRGPLCEKEKESERLFITFRKCSIAAIAAKRIEMATGSLRALFGPVPVLLWAQSGLTPSLVRASSELIPGLIVCNRIEMASGLLWARFGFVTGSVRTHSELALGLVRADVGLVLGLRIESRWLQARFGLNLTSSGLVPC